jgi:hypothetical protein
LVALTGQEVYSIAIATTRVADFIIAVASMRLTTPMVVPAKAAGIFLARVDARIYAALFKGRWQTQLLRVLYGYV